jgi:NRPS condensation-like uncharacterized protein
MKTGLLWKKLESILNSFMLKVGKFTGSLTLKINFRDGEAKDIEKKVRERIKL